MVLIHLHHWSVLTAESNKSLQVVFTGEVGTVALPDTNRAT